MFCEFILSDNGQRIDAQEIRNGTEFRPTEKRKSRKREYENQNGTNKWRIRLATRQKSTNEINKKTDKADASTRTLHHAKSIEHLDINFFIFFSL